MPNAGYPDDDGSRTPSGPHDLGRQRVTCYPGDKYLRPTTVMEHVATGEIFDGRTDSAGDQPSPNYDWSVDGCPSAGVAGYPPKPEDPNARD